jgi:DNA mismatch repair ATPase MutS
MMASKKDAYIAKLRAQLDEWGTEIDKLKAKADKAGADIQLEYHRQVDELRAMQATADQKLTELKEASEHTWDSLKENIDIKWNSLGDKLKAVTSKFQ